MKKAHMPDAHSSHPNVTPLIDIVMCLIIFFMLIAKIGVNTGAIRTIKIPVSIQGIDLGAMGGSVVFNVMPGSATFPNVQARLKQKDGTEADQAFGDARMLIGSLISLREKGGADFKVVVRAPENMQFIEVHRFLKACADAKIKNVAYNTLKP